MSSGRQCLAPLRRGLQTYLLQPAAWRALYPEGLHWLLSLEYLSNLNIEPDELHILYLGTSQYMLGSVLWMLAYSVLASTPQDNMALVWQRITEVYTTTQVSCQYTSLALSSFTDQKQPNAHFPKLKGKGAEMKCLAPVLLQVWRECDVQAIIDEHATELFLPVAAAASLQRSVVELLSNTPCSHTRLTRGVNFCGIWPQSFTGCGILAKGLSTFALAAALASSTRIMSARSRW